MCTCITETNEAIKGYNVKLDIIMMTNGAENTVRIATEKIDPKDRKPSPPIIPSYCPFCGKEYAVTPNN